MLGASRPTVRVAPKAAAPPATKAPPPSAAARTPVVEVRGLHKWYGKVHALDGVDLDIHAGDVMGFLGPNGAGKTTFTKCVLGFLRPTQGYTRLFGQDVQGKGRAALGRVGLVPDQYDFYGTLTGKQHLDYYARLHRLPPRDIPGRIEDLAGRLDMKDFVARRVSGYSHGMKQRLCIAQALINDPDFVIFDEPTNGLDPRGAFETRRLIKGLAKGGRAIFMSSHILTEVEDVCSRVTILSKGRVLVQSGVAELRQRMKGSMVRVTIHLERPDASVARLARDRAGALKADLEGEVLKVELGAQAGIPELVSLLAKNGARIRGVHEETVGLEEMFLELTKGEGGV